MAAAGVVRAGARPGLLAYPHPDPLVFCSLKNEKPSAIYRIKGLTQQGSSSAGGVWTAGVGISIESVGEVDAQMVSMKGSSAGADMDQSMQVESAPSTALVRPGDVDAGAQANMALALAPRIGA